MWTRRFRTARRCRSHINRHRAARDASSANRHRRADSIRQRPSRQRSRGDGQYISSAIQWSPAAVDVSVVSVAVGWRRAWWWGGRRQHSTVWPQRGWACGSHRSDRPDIVRREARYIYRQWDDWAPSSAAVLPKATATTWWLLSWLLGCLAAQLNVLSIWRNLERISANVQTKRLVASARVQRTLMLCRQATMTPLKQPWALIAAVTAVSPSLAPDIRTDICHTCDALQPPPRKCRRTRVVQWVVCDQCVRWYITLYA